ncbi:NAD(P)/FAD-dependent oxidoreductase [Aspergillus thermomutatus]|uniref:FAD dependent oxidoreductase domain-containing protein n=1 Tax=Aspergillus thermomutatus TaxID=41047 RepID=A0A397HCJ6_ASPTH|nr:uncharacterized protein CDV56_105839 [Aspergillus thermomutatus]RHZ60697.1 hypothetical protein CDV56_105839 [Aspergillus thermomutatus]
MQSDPKDNISYLLTTDPGLPASNPTPSYWQEPPHPLSHTKSPTLPRQTDIAIIGSGITGLAVCKTLLEAHPATNITIFEARALCSGATGRNGGQLAANAGEEYAHLAGIHGSEMAGRIVHFTLKNLQKMEELCSAFATEEGELQKVTKLRVFLTDGAFEQFERSVKLMERDHPSLRGLYTVLDAGGLKEEYNVDGAGGALLPAGTVWPYRVVTSTFARLFGKHPSRLSIETNTPVTEVNYDQTSKTHPYTIRTPRGSVRATKIAYCTNGYASHLLPNLRGRIYPFKGTMTVQDPGNFPNRGKDLSWGFHYPALYDAKTGSYQAGLYYLMQNTRSGYFFFGGEDKRLEDCLSADDTRVEAGSVENLQRKLPSCLGGTEAEAWRLVSAWSGVMGFSADGLPVVGQLPALLTGRDGDGEYLAAAFNGYGMANCLLSGEALARIMLGEDVSDWLPEAYAIHPRRLEKLTLHGAVKSYLNEVY